MMITASIMVAIGVTLIVGSQQTSFRNHARKLSQWFKPFVKGSMFISKHISDKEAESITKTWLIGSGLFLVAIGLFALITR